jgi:DNA-binding NtrC family response regulator
VKLNPSPKSTVRVLAALPDNDDRAALRNIFRRSNWSVAFTESYDEASSALVTASFGVSIIEADLGDGRDWKHVLDLTQAMAVPVPVIVTKRLADELLWAEVLNLGGYDVLLKPFDPTEVYRVVSSAWLSWRQQCEHAQPRNPEGRSSKVGEERPIGVSSARGDSDRATA